MKIIILGAGQVGGSLAENLVAEGHEITLVDLDGERLQYLQTQLDIRTVVGRCSYPDVLHQAGAEDADMLIAVTDSDESNMLACQVAYSLFSVPKKIARIRSQHYFINPRLFGDDNLPIDVFISPEQLLTESVKELIFNPGALQVLNFADGRVKLLAVKPYYGGHLLGKTIANLREFLAGVEFQVVGIFRNEHSIDVEDSTVIEIGDEVFIVTAVENTQQIMQALRRVCEPYKRIMIAGGGNVGAKLANDLQHDFSVKLVEKNHERAVQLAAQLDNVTVLCGNVCDRDLLIEENIKDTDVFCAVTDNDENNIISSLQAKRLGAKQVMTLVARTAYVDLIEGGQINIAISPQQATVGSILAHLKKGDIANVHSLRRGAAEAMEGIIHGDEKTSRLVGKKLAKVKLPEGTRIGAIVRKEQVIMPTDEIILQTNDHVILFVSEKKHLLTVEKLFQVSAGFF